MELNCGSHMALLRRLLSLSARRSACSVLALRREGRGPCSASLRVRFPLGGRSVLLI